MHPDRNEALYVTNGLKNGFTLLFDSRSKLPPATANCSSTIAHPKIIDAYLSKRIQLSGVAGPFLSPPIRNIQISRFGSIPKKFANEWRLILDVSHPEGRSVNDGTDPSKCHTQYCKVDDAINVIVAAAQVALISH